MATKTELQNLKVRAYAQVWAIFAIALIFASTLASTELSADGTTTVNCATGSGITDAQRSQYCASAQSSSQGSDVDSSLYKVWGGVAAVCTAACANPSPSLAGTCKWTDRAGAGTDAVATKNYSSALMSIATGQVAGQMGKAGAQQGANGAQQGGQQGTQASAQGATPGTTPTPKPPSRATACLNAATSGMQAVSKYKSAQSATQATQANTASANQLANSNGGSVGNDPNEKSSGATAGELYEGNRQLSEGQSGATAGIAAAGSAGACATARQPGQVAATIQCAVANDPTLPSYVATPQFLNDFKAATGTDFSNFGNDPNQSAGDSIAQAASGGLSNGAATQVAAVMRSMDNNNSQAPYESAAYASAGSAPAAAVPAAEEPDMAQVAQALLDQMKAGQQPNEQQTAATGIQAVVFANQTRAPASIPEDKTLSIFDRVTYRYLYTTKVTGLGSSK